MMKRITYYFILMCVVMSSSSAWAAGQKITTEGTEFLVAFMSNGHSKKETELDLRLYFSGRQNATITVTNPNTNWSSAPITITKNTIDSLVVPQAAASYLRYASTGAENVSLLVKSTTPISVYAIDAYTATTGATCVWPFQALGTDYVLQSYDANYDGNRDYSGQFVVIATEDNTSVRIVPSVNLQNNHPAKQPFTILLPKKGQSYFFRAEYKTNLSICGTTVSADKPVAVFNGNSSCYIPKGADGADHLFETACPIALLGDTFGLTKVSLAYDMVRFTAVKDSTEIKIDGQKKATLKALETYEYKLSNDACFVVTTKPVVCNSFLSGAEANGFDALGDPAMVINPALEQMIDTITFVATKPGNGTNDSRVTEYYVNVVTRSYGAGLIQLDGTTIAKNQFKAFSSNPNYIYTRQKISDGAHTLTGDKVAFMAMVYCIGQTEAYAYNAGCGANIIFDTLRYNTQDTICASQLPYLWRGQQLTKAGTYSDTVMSKIIPGKTDSIITLELTVFEAGQSHDFVSICNAQLPYKWKGLFCPSAGDYTFDTLTTHGCDSLLTLHLFVTDVPKSWSVDTTICDTLLPYNWRGILFDEPYEYRDTILGVQGCDSVYRVIRLDTIHCKPACVDTLVYRKWNDVLFCNNGQKTILSYQWYRDTIAIVGETHQQLYMPAGMGEAAYWVEVTYLDGTVVKTCPLRFEDNPASAATYVKMNTVIRRGGNLHIEMSDTEADLRIFTLLGTLVEEDKLSSSISDLPMWLPEGIYMVQVQGDNVKHTQKILIE